MRTARRIALSAGGILLIAGLGAMPTPLGSLEWWCVVLGVAALAVAVDWFAGGEES